MVQYICNKARDMPKGLKLPLKKIKKSLEKPLTLNTYYDIIKIQNKQRPLTKGKKGKFIMTNREFYEKVMATCENEELVEFAKMGIEKLDAKNAKRSATPSKNAIANAPYRQEILDLLASVGVPMKASEILASLNHEGFTINKVNGLVGVLVKEGKVVKATETGVPKSKAKVVYSIATD